MVKPLAAWSNGLNEFLEMVEVATDVVLGEAGASGEVFDLLPQRAREVLVAAVFMVVCREPQLTFETYENPDSHKQQHHLDVAETQAAIVG